MHSDEDAMLTHKINTNEMKVFEKMVLLIVTAMISRDFCKSVFILNQYNS